MKLKDLRELINRYPLSDDDTEFEVYNAAGDMITDPVDIHEDETEDGSERILILG